MNRREVIPGGVPSVTMGTRVRVSPILRIAGGSASFVSVGATR